MKQIAEMINAGIWYIQGSSSSADAVNLPATLPN